MHGRRVPISLPRRTVQDLLYFASRVPSIPVQRMIDVQAAVEARAAVTDRPSWTAIFTKAYAVVADEIPALRRAFIDLPRPYLREYPSSVASIAVERMYGEEPSVFTFRIKSPSRKRLSRITQIIRRFSNDPIDRLHELQRSLRLAAWPRLLRRAVWWLALNSPIHKRNHFGTYAVSVYSAFGAESLHPLSPLATMLNYGIIDPEGKVIVRVVYDHRVLDGATVARALIRLEEVLNDHIVQELRSLRTESPA